MLADWLHALVRGKTVACLASGPSLTAEDCAAVRAAGLPALVTNTTFRLAPWADVLVAFDVRWWDTYRAEVDAVFKGRLVGCAGRRHGVQSTAAVPGFRPFGNSGTAAIALASFGGARRIVLLGCDAQRSGGRAHWHGDHPPQLSNARSIAGWPGKFARVAEFARRRGCDVVNASRETALTCFPRVALEDALEAAG